MSTPNPASPLFQELQNVLEDIGAGVATVSDAQNLVLDIQRHLGLPLTEPSEWGTLTPEQIADFEAHERKYV